MTSTKRLSVTICREGAMNARTRVFVVAVGGGNTFLYINMLKKWLRVMSREWNTGLFGCFHDPVVCVQTLFCPCVTYGQIAEKFEGNNLIGHGKCFEPCCCFAIGMLCGCEPCFVLNMRHQVIEEKQLDQENLCLKFVKSWLCFYCVLCQMHAEYKKPSLEQYTTVYTAPPMFANTMIINTHY